MSSKIDIYLSHLWELGRTDLHLLEEVDFTELTSLIIKETPLKLLPFFEKYDVEREIMLMMATWMDREDRYTGDEILSRMSGYMITAMTPLIQDRLENYAKRQGQKTEIFR